MQKILFLTFFGYRAYIYDIKTIFEKNNYTVFDVPYLQLKNDDKYTDQMIIDKIIKMTNELQIDTIFMFLLPSLNDFITKMKEGLTNNKVKIIFYNFDDPNSLNIDLVRYSKGLDYFFTPYDVTASKMKYLCSDTIKYVYSIPKYYLIENQTDTKTITKSYDLCILYNRQAEEIYDMKMIIRDIKLTSLDKGLTIKLLGDTDLESVYSDIYEGNYDIKNINKQINDSKIIIYINDSSLNTKKEDELIIELFKTGAIVMTTYTNRLKHILRDDNDCLIFDKATYIKKLLTCLNYYDKYKLMSSNAKTVINKELTIDKWFERLQYYLNNNK